MASFNSIIRRANAIVRPLARSAGSRSTTFSVSAASCIGKLRIVRQQLLYFPFSQYCTDTSLKRSADESLVRVLQSEIDCADQPTDVNEIKPEGFPFEIQDNPGEKTVFLERKYQDEIIKVLVEMPSIPDEDADVESVDGEAEPAVQPSMPLVVSVSKGNDECLEFGVTAFPDEITIDAMSIKSSDSSEDLLAYEGPDFSDLDENLQKAFHKYLEIRGIKPSTTNFLFDYMTNKDTKEYLQWLKNLKNFVEN